jgi:hypothetical protein
VSFRCSSPSEAEAAVRASGETNEPAERMVRLSQSGYIRQQTFLGVGGMKVFRDDLWSELKVVFRADHKAYKQRGYYDFPQKQIGKRIVMRLAYFITGLPGIRSQFPSMIRTQMSMPMRKAALADYA